MTNFFLALQELKALAALDPERGQKLDPVALQAIGKRAGKWLDLFIGKPATQTTKEPA